MKVYYVQWLKYKQFGVGTPIRKRLATSIRGVETLMCQTFEVWQRRSRPFSLTLNTDYMIAIVLTVFIVY